MASTIAAHSDTECFEDMYTPPKTNITNLRPGSRVPGYTGYSPTRKYRIGGTYGNDMMRVYTERMEGDFTNGAPRLPLRPTCSAPTSDQVPFISKLSNDHLYHDEMMPGYTGFIPRSHFMHGMSYRDLTQLCIRDAADKILTSEKSTLKSIKKRPSLETCKNDLANRTLPPISPRKTLQKDRRSFTEAPVPGYTGYIPNVKKADAGLGVRHHVASEQGLDQFVCDRKLAQEAEGMPVRLRRGKFKCGRTRRLYIPEGMDPKYTGYIPGSPFAIGLTKGNVSRESSACKVRSID